MKNGKMKSMVRANVKGKLRARTGKFDKGKDAKGDCWSYCLLLLWE